MSARHATAAGTTSRSGRSSSRRGLGDVYKRQVVVRGARTLGRHHGGAQRLAGGAQRPEGLALVGLDQALQDFAAAADLRLLGDDVGDREPLGGIEVAVLLGQLPARAGDHPDAAPVAVGDREDVGEHPAGVRVAVALHGPRVRVLHLGPAGLELQNRLADALEDVERLEPGDHDRDVVLPVSYTHLTLPTIYSV